MKGDGVGAPVEIQIRDRDSLGDIIRVHRCAADKPARRRLVENRKLRSRTVATIADHDVVPTVSIDIANTNARSQLVATEVAYNSGGKTSISLKQDRNVWDGVG